MLTKLWKDETGAVLTVELILVASIVLLGAVSGLTMLRDAVATELGDLARAISLLDQGYEVPWVRGPSSWTAGTLFIDGPDATDVDEVGGTNSRCITIGSTALAGPFMNERGGSVR